MNARDTLPTEPATARGFGVDQCGELLHHFPGLDSITHHAAGRPRTARPAPARTAPRAIHRAHAPPGPRDVDHHNTIARLTRSPGTDKR
jgi:hypothetical protein